MKLSGKRSAGNLHAAFDVAGAGNVIARYTRQSSTLPEEGSARVTWQFYVSPGMAFF